MVTLKQLLLRIQNNLLILREKEAKFGGDVPVRLTNEIEDHLTAIELIEQALATDQSEAGLKQLKEQLKPLLGLSAYVERIDDLLADLKPELPPLPFEPEVVLIPAGPFLMGSQQGEEVPIEETPQHEILLPDFEIGKYPVTNAQYAEFIKQEKQQPVPKKAGWFLREPPPDKLDHPVVGVSWYDARAYCDWLTAQTGRTYRLPTEAEWEKAARGEQGQIYPWGNRWEAERANQGNNDTTAVTTFPAGASPYGCCDIVGNVQQWTGTLWGSDLNDNTFPYPYQSNDGREDLAADQHLHRVFRLHRGGSYRDDPAKLRCSARSYSDPDSKIRWRGFRVLLER